MSPLSIETYICVRRNKELDVGLGLLSPTRIDRNPPADKTRVQALAKMLKKHSTAGTFPPPAVTMSMALSPS